MATNTEAEEPKEEESKEEVKTPAEIPISDNRPWVKKNMEGRFADQKQKFSGFKPGFKFPKKIINRKTPN